MTYEELVKIYMTLDKEALAKMLAIKECGTETRTPNYYPYYPYYPYYTYPDTITWPNTTYSTTGEIKHSSSTTFDRSRDC